MATYLIIVFQILPLDGGTLSKLHSPTLHVTSWWPHFALYNTCMQYLAILALHWLTMTMVMILSHCMWPLGDPPVQCIPPVLNHKLHCKLWRMMKYTPHPLQIPSTHIVFLQKDLSCGLAWQSWHPVVSGVSGDPVRSHFYQIGKSGIGIVVKMLIGRTVSDNNPIQSNPIQSNLSGP